MSIYKQYCNEIVDKNGRLQKITLEYPDNFNFGYDVVDKIAKLVPTNPYSGLLNPTEQPVIKTVKITD